MILFEFGCIFPTQPYLLTLYRALFIIAYYGLFRIGELVKGDHTVLACNVHTALNKKKSLLILYSSKTHDKNVKPQKIKISSLCGAGNFKHFCPFTLLNNYLTIRGDYVANDEVFFVHLGHIPVEQSSVREVMATAITNIGLNPWHFTFHGLRAGRTTNLYHWGFTIEEIKAVGRWKSNAIYRYIKD